MKNNNKGFTLIELLATLTILGIMMVIAIPNVQKFIDRSKEDNLDANTKMLYMAAKSYYQTNPQELPKQNGASYIITSGELKYKNFLKDYLKNGNKQTCTYFKYDSENRPVFDSTKDSHVIVKKEDKNKYSYTVKIICNADGKILKEVTY